MRKVMAREGMTWPSCYDGAGDRGPIAKRYHVWGYPSIFLIDAKGVIRARKSFSFIEDVDKLLEEMKAQRLLTVCRLLRSKKDEIRSLQRGHSRFDALLMQRGFTAQRLEITFHTTDDLRAFRPHGQGRRTAARENFVAGPHRLGIRWEIRSVILTRGYHARRHLRYLRAGSKQKPGRACFRISIRWARSSRTLARMKTSRDLLKSGTYRASGRLLTNRRSLGKQQPTTDVQIFSAFDLDKGLFRFDRTQGVIRQIGRFGHGSRNRQVRTHTRVGDYVD